MLEKRLRERGGVVRLGAFLRLHAEEVGEGLGQCFGCVDARTVSRACGSSCQRRGSLSGPRRPMDSSSRRGIDALWRLASA